jgi:hypothetical protein
MKPNKLSNAQHLGMVPSRTRIQSLNDRRYITEYTGIHESCLEKQKDKIRIKNKKKKHSSQSIKPTSDQHNAYGEYLFGICVGRHIAKAHRGQRCECKV